MKDGKIWFVEMPFFQKIREVLFGKMTSKYATVVFNRTFLLFR